MGKAAHDMADVKAVGLAAAQDQAHHAFFMGRAVAAAGFQLAAMGALEGHSGGPGAILAQFADGRCAGYSNHAVARAIEHPLDDPDAARAAFWAGQCGMALTWPTGAKQEGLPKDPPPGCEVGFLELFGNSGPVLGNPLLAPEKGRSFDIGLVPMISTVSP